MHLKINTIHPEIEEIKQSIQNALILLDHQPREQLKNEILKARLFFLESKLVDSEDHALTLHLLCLYFVSKRFPGIFLHASGKFVPIIIKQLQAYALEGVIDADTISKLSLCQSAIISGLLKGKVPEETILLLSQLKLTLLSEE